VRIRLKHLANGGYIITGSTESFGSGNQDAWLIKVDANGMSSGTEPSAENVMIVADQFSRPLMAGISSQVPCIPITQRT
jgi:hypothetical protein